MRKAGYRLLDLRGKRFIRNDLTLYTTCEPCPMCSCTILMSGIKHIVWAALNVTVSGLRVFFCCVLVSLPKPAKGVCQSTLF
ncbi:deaminase [Paenibacillus sp. sgz500958]|uniref:deaminase n=1 Tax=Paenibacillus sp. sgz500958 TaxID=3242475 RepID=UPI0036D34CBE